ncbi:hypothetical protein [Microtetraspora malaysiensis]|uniref:Uncharacterized protein n=1 Tax=Microtetraspora malaysiensis TaxID=161358 RepID=A0ABW6SY31_9ACTN
MPRRVRSARAPRFQPSSMAPWDLLNDFDLWRNIVWELSEELLGTPEHDGSRSVPIDYDATGSGTDARASGLQPSDYGGDFLVPVSYRVSG